MPDREELAFDASHGPISNPDNSEGMLNDLPSGVNRLCDIIQETLLLDRVAELTSVNHWSFEKIQSTYQQEEGLADLKKWLTKARKFAETLPLK